MGTRLFIYRYFQAKGMEKVGVACSGGFALWQLPGMRGEGVGNGGGPSGHGMLLQLCFVTTAEDAG